MREPIGAPALTPAHVASRQFGRHPGGPHFNCRTCAAASVLLNLVQHEAESAEIGPALIHFIERANPVRSALNPRYSMRAVGSSPQRRHRATRRDGWGASRVDLRRPVRTPTRSEQAGCSAANRTPQAPAGLHADASVTRPSGEGDREDEAGQCPPRREHPDPSPGGLRCGGDRRASSMMAVLTRARPTACGSAFRPFRKDPPGDSAAGSKRNRRVR